MSGLKWWQEGVVYQIYPRSFCDSNGDGIGDINGIISKLDYLSNLGINIIWLSPLYKSPNDDNGYDISDYKEINPEFGTMTDFDNLLNEAHKRGIKIIMDLVVNHTSDEHEWFVSSRDKNSPYRDYYVWKEGINKSDKNPYGDAPNNWTSFFTGSAWQLDTQSGEYYLHLFSKKQPDLNWDNPKIYDEVENILKFWLDKGIDGFRCDVINVIGKTDYGDGETKIGLTGYNKYVSSQKCHAILRRLRENVFDKYDCFTVGETVLVNTDMANDLCAPERKELDMVFGFEHMETDQIKNKWFKKRFSPKKFIQVLDRWQNSLQWNANYFENHDQPRSLSRFCRTDNPQCAKMLGALLFSLKGTPYIFEGQEIGMTNGDFKNLSEIKDVESLHVDKIAKKMGIPKFFRWKLIKYTSRDNARTPMQWSDKENGGFTSGKPWLKVNSNYSFINAESQLNDKNSVLNSYKAMISFRKNSETLLCGDFKLIKATNTLIIFERILGGKKFIVAANFSKSSQKIDYDNIIAFSTNNNETDRKTSNNKVFPYETIIMEG